MSYLLIQWIQGLCSFQRPVLLLVFWITCSFSILKDFALAIILSLTYISNFLLSNGLFPHTTICHNTLCKRKKNYLDPICLFILSPVSLLLLWTKLHELTNYSHWLTFFPHIFSTVLFPSTLLLSRSLIALILPDVTVSSLFLSWISEHYGHALFFLKCFLLLASRSKQSLDFLFFNEVYSYTLCRLLFCSVFNARVRKVSVLGSFSLYTHAP